MSDIKKISITKEQLLTKQPPTMFGKVLPFLLIASFAFAGFYNVARNIGVNTQSIFGSGISFVLVDVLFVSVVQYFIFLLILWIYKFILKTQPYFALVGERDFGEIYGFCYLLRNLLLGVFGFLQFRFAYLGIFMPLVSLMLSYLTITATYFISARKMDIMFRHMYYRIMMLPWFVWQAITILISLIFGGAIL